MSAPLRCAAAAALLLTTAPAAMAYDFAPVKRYVAFGDPADIADMAALLKLPKSSGRKAR
jgi:hypothetical protein